MLIFAFLVIVGAAVTLYSASFIAPALRARDKKRLALAIAVPVLFWLAWLWLFAADRKFVARYNQEHPEAPIEE